MKKNIATVLLTSLVTLSIFSACVRERDTDVDIVKEEVLGEMIYDNTLSIVDDAGTKSTGELLANYKMAGYCADIIHDTFSNPRKIIIDFGVSNCLCNDGRIRRGKIIAEYTGGKYTDTTSSTLIQFDNYFLNDMYVTGTMKIANMGHNVVGQKYFEIETEGKFIKLIGEDTVYWNASRTRTWIQGENTPMWGDDIYKLEGKGNGKNANKQYYSMNITDPLIRDLSCRYITKGIIEMQPQGKTLRTLDYGDGSCDNDATVVLDKKAFHIELR
ncbi:MAG TPA: hypothetical protein PKA54_00250 [Chitinophagaceae bacterium]|nr:hypothetical protein [Chitinophagaceae bacterium]